MPGTDDTPTTDIKNLELSSGQIKSVLDNKKTYLAAGGSGTIYELESTQQADTTTEQPNHQKVIKEINLDSDQETQEIQKKRIHNEVEITAKIKGKDKVNFHIDEENNKAYIIMPKEKGKDLFEYLKTSLESLRPSEENLYNYSNQSYLRLQCYLSLQALDAVIEAANSLHIEYNIIHGDLMLENVFINKDNQPDAQISSKDLSFIDFEDSSQIDKPVIKPLPNTPTCHKSPDRKNENEHPTSHPHHDWYTIASRMSNLIPQICEGDLIRPYLSFLEDVKKDQNINKLEDWQPKLTYSKLKQDLDNLKRMEHEQVIDNLITDFIAKKMTKTSNSHQSVINNFCQFCPGFLSQTLQDYHNQFNDKLVKKAVENELKHADDNMKNQAERDLKNKTNDIDQFKQQYLKICEIGIYQRAFKQYQRNRSGKPDPLYQEFAQPKSFAGYEYHNFKELCKIARDKSQGWFGGRFHKDSFMMCVMREAKDHPLGNDIFQDFLGSNDEKAKGLWDKQHAFPAETKSADNRWRFFQSSESRQDRDELLDCVTSYANQ